MSTSPRGGALRPFRLQDVPLGLRLRAKERLLTTDGTKDGILVASQTFGERLRIGLAAERPSERVYWISEKAWKRVIR